jgi:ABC-type transporter MlaC component
MKAGLGGALLGLSLVLGAAPARADEDPALSAVHVFLDRFVDGINAIYAHGAEGSAPCLDRFNPAFEQAFDFPAMATDLVPPGTHLSAEERQKLGAALERGLVAGYAGLFVGAITIDGDVQARGSDRVVFVTLAEPKRKTRMGYRLRKLDGTWKIVDARDANNTSTVDVVRRQVAEKLAAGGVNAVTQQLNALAMLQRMRLALVCKQNLLPSWMRRHSSPLPPVRVVGP